MASSENEASYHSTSSASDEPRSLPTEPTCIQKFRLYETLSNFYMIGTDKNKTYWRVLKIGRLDPSELNVREDSTTYTESECSDLLRRIHEGNKSTGGLKFVTTCYGIVGFIKFLGPYYMLLITKRRQIGAICGHRVYAVSKSEMIPLRSSSVQSDMTYTKTENRYKKLLSMVDLTKDFYFSYSYQIMRSLQRNLCENETGHVLYETMFVWNEFLTRGIRNNLQNTLWTVALVYGFFKQDMLTISGRQFILTLVARRSRHYAGTRYLRRGVNEKGRVANDVETEQIVFEAVPEGLPVQISSVVQNRGSIPLFWSQETSRLNLKPDIILSKKDENYQATKLHFENLVKRYGNPIIILNLIKTLQAIDVALYFTNSHGRGSLQIYKLTPNFRPEDSIKWPSADFAYGNVDKGSFQPTRHADVDIEDANNLERKPGGGNNITNGKHSVKHPMFQAGVLRTNCIDCLDRTNVAQYAYGLAALGHQLHVLGVIDNPKIDPDHPLDDGLMGFYEQMGDTLAHQYGGSAAHNKIFSERRGQWRAATQSQEFFRTLQRYYSNAYMDAEKQNAINIFLGHFQPQQGKPALWELDSDQHYDVGRHGDDDARSIVKRCFSDGNIVRDSSTPISAPHLKHGRLTKLGFLDQSEDGSRSFCDSSPEISTCESDMSFSRYAPPVSRRQLFGEMQRDCCFENDQTFYSEHPESFSSSNFVDLNWLSSINSCEEEHERSSIPRPSKNVGNGITGGDATPSTSDLGSSNKGREPSGSDSSHNDTRSKILEEFPDSFVHWVTHGQTLCH
ncbi:hypothetical protein PIB30_057243 [Stylosanthes scabra]|uniref:SAC domain-containing protein n=1 Tax=Stylosanthes scabra TaxID=79078 RepID=A0ABU6SJI3_9FABA|nr:hypothetical protein [Stylosanthes scabra]